MNVKKKLIFLIRMDYIENIRYNGYIGEILMPIYLLLSLLLFFEVNTYFMIDSG